VDRRALSGGAVQFRPDRDRHGPLPVAALVRIHAGDDREGRIVVVGDADFATNLHLGVLGNRDLLLVTAELAVRPNAYTASRPPRRDWERSRRGRLGRRARVARGARGARRGAVRSRDLWLRR